MLPSVKQVNAYVSLDNKLATCSVSSIDELCDREGDNGSDEDKGAVPWLRWSVTGFSLQKVFLKSSSVFPNQ
jgi:hypothetical protein